VPSQWSRFRMALWALRTAVVGAGAWECLQSEQSARRLNSGSRRRKLQKLPDWTT
jgi:hypothetical protein